MNTNAIERRSEPLTLDALNDLARPMGRMLFGFVVSHEAMNALKLRCQQASRDNTPIFALNSVLGVEIIVDPKMPATEFEVAFTEEAWRKRKAELAKNRVVMVLAEIF